MLEEVKKFADAGDVKSLKYIFVDSLDVDPTFEDYLDDYNYCVIKGLFEPHKKLNDFSNRKSDWNDDYWQILKRDLLKNFSRERLDHMRKVALVVLADKVERLKRERQQNRQPATPPKVSQPPAAVRPAIPPPPLKSKAQQQQEELEAAKRQLEKENAEAEQQQKSQQQEVYRKQQENLQRKEDEDSQLKKAPGIASKIVIGIVVLGAVGAVGAVVALVKEIIIPLLLEP